jgi:predicted NUDIX family phosphoesterase
VVPRPEAEDNPAWKQPIAYCTVVRDDGQMLCVERLRHQGEGRLHGQLSIGLGGHIEPDDLAGGGGPVRAALSRELHEELVLPLGLPPPEFLGLINDDSTAVGRVHFGLAFCQRVPARGIVQIRESRKMRGAFRHLAGPQGVWQDLARFETWSRILLEARVVEALANTRPAARRSSCGKTQEEP